MLATVLHAAFLASAAVFSTFHRAAAGEDPAAPGRSLGSDYASAMAHERLADLGAAAVVLAGLSFAGAVLFALLSSKWRLAIGNAYVLGALLLLAEASTQLAGLHVPAIARPGEIGERGLWIYDETLGWFHRPRARGRLARPDGEWVEVRLNSLGLRGPEIPTRGANRPRVVVLGDSFVFGVGVPEEAVFSRRLQEHLSRRHGPVEVVNLGVSGYSTDQELLMLRRFGASLEPDVVVLVMHTNDYLGNAQDFVYQQYYKPYVRVDARGGVSLENQPVPRLGRLQLVKRFLGRESNLWNLARTANVERPWARRMRSAFEVGTSRVPRRPHKATRAVVALVQAESKVLGAHLFVMNTGVRRPDPFTLLAPFLEERAVAHLDLWPALSGAMASEPHRHWILEDGGEHWDRDGHELAAEIASTRLAPILAAVGARERGVELGVARH